MSCSPGALAAGICRRAMATCSSVGSRRNYFRSATMSPCSLATARPPRSARSGGRIRSCARDRRTLSLRGSELSFAFSDNVERDQRGEGADESAERHRGRRAEKIGHDASFEAAERNHSSEDERPDSHDTAAHFVGDDGLQDGVGGGEIEDDTEPDKREEHHAEIQILVEGEEGKRDGENPDAAERHDPRG